MNAAQRVVRSLQGWLLLAGFVLTGWLAVTLFAGDVADMAGGQGLLPAPFCSDAERSSERLSSSRRVGRAVVSYSRNGCNALSPERAQRFARAVSAEQRQLETLGVRFDGPVHVAALKVGAPLQFRADGADAAFGVNVSSRNQRFLVAQGTAGVALSKAASGMSRTDQKNLSEAFAFLVAGNAQTIAAARARAGAGSNSGLFYAWVMAQLGTQPVLDAVRACAAGCDFDAELDRQIRDRGRDSGQMRRDFTAA
jgi:hypothetical protein